LIGYVRGALDFAYKKKLIPANEGVCIDRDAILCHSIPPKPYEDEERVLNEDEVIALYEATKKHIKAHPAYMPNYGILLALMTGMRAGEIAALKWSDVDDLYIHIRHSEHRVDYTSHKDALEHYDGLVNMYEWIEPKEYFANHNARSIMVVGEPKCRKHRDFPVVPQIRALFAEIRALGTTSKDDFIFVRKDGKRHSGHDISCALERRSIEAGIKKASIHMLRRTFSSNAQTQHPRELVASLLGHLEKTNAQHYDYDTSTYEYKKNMVSSMYSNVLKMPS
jgi:integrase